MQDKTATTEDTDQPAERSWTDPGGNPLRVTELRAKLYGKAKREPSFRFYSLFGQILRRDVLQASWDRVAANNGSPGVDGVTIEAVVTSPGGVPLLLDALERELRAGRIDLQR